MTWLERFLPKLGRNLLLLEGAASCSGFFRNCAALLGAFRFFFDVTLIMSKLSGSIMDWAGAAEGSK